MDAVSPEKSIYDKNNVNNNNTKTFAHLWRSGVRAINSNEAAFLNDVWVGIKAKFQECNNTNST